MVSKLPDDALSRAQVGEPAAFESIYAHLSPSLLGYFAGRGAEDPEALTQEVFLAVFSRLDSVHGGVEGLKTLVFSVAHARYVDEVRRLARRPSQAVYEPESDARTSVSAEAAALNRFGEGNIEQLLAALKAEHREVLLLRIVAGLSVDQVAKVVGKTEGSVKQLQRRALIKLRELVELDEAEAS